jgi:hypothetical protein
VKRILLFIALTLMALACSAPSQGPSGGSNPGPDTTNVEDVEPAITGPRDTFGDGQYEIGTGAGQIRPGKYTTTVPGNSTNCYWERQRRVGGGTIKDIIANANFGPHEPVIINIENTDAGFKAQGCGKWVKA